MQLRPSMRRAAKMRLALAGASGSGKTYSSLLIAYGMTSDWSRVAVIDSENGSADLYAHLGNYQVLTLPDYSPETYIEAIGICEQAGAEVIVIDSISHCWDYLLDFHANLQGNSFANWAKVTPRQNAFNAFSTPRATSSAPCVPNRIMSSRTRTARWYPRRWA